MLPIKAADLILWKSFELEQEAIRGQGRSGKVTLKLWEDKLTSGAATKDQETAIKANWLLFRVWAIELK